MNALQGAIFYGKSNSSLTYVIMNRGNYSIAVDLTESAPYQSVTIHEYIGNQTITETTYPIDIDNVEYPVAGPIPIQISSVNKQGVYTHEFAPYALTVLTFNWFEVEEPTLPPTPSPVDVCAQSVRFEQTQQSLSPFTTQWLVRLHTGANDLYNVKIRVSPTPPSIWNLNPVAGEDGVYTVPEYQYEHGSIPAYRSCLTFGYNTVGGAIPYNVTLANDACSVVSEGCSSSVENVLTSEWVSGGVLFQQYSFNVVNTGARSIASTNVEISYTGGATLYQYWNLVPVQGSTSSFFISTGKVLPGATNTSGGYQITIPNGVLGTKYTSLSETSEICF